MTREQIATMLDLAAAGHVAAAIGREIGAPLDNVRSGCRARGVTLKRGKPARKKKPGRPAPAPWTEFDDFRLVEMFGARRTDSEIARNLGRSHDDVRKRRTALRLLRRGAA